MTRAKPTRFFVRPLEKADVPTLTQWFLDLDDLALFDRSMRIPLNREAADKSWVELLGNDSRSRNYWFAITCEQGNPIGIIGLESISVVNGDAIVPMCVDTAARNKGVGIRSLALVLDIAFRQLRLNRLTSFYRADNEASRSMTERAGFRQEGRMRQAWFAEGELFDMIAIGILREEWMQRRRTLAEELDRSTVVSFGRGTSGKWSWPPTETGKDPRKDAKLGVLDG